MKRLIGLRTTAALVMLPVAFATTAAFPVGALAQSAQRATPYVAAPTDNAADAALMIAALNNAGYDAKLVNQGDTAPVISVERNGLIFTIKFENCIFDSCTRARFIKKFEGDFSSSKAVSWNSSEESDAEPESVSAGNLGLDLKIYDPKITTERFDAHLARWLPLLTKFERYISGRSQAQPTSQQASNNDELSNDNRKAAPGKSKFVVAGNSPDGASELRAFIAKADATDTDKMEARYNLGKLYLRGEGISQDYALAGEQFALAGNLGNGHNRALYELGMLYLEGKGVGQDYAEAARLFQKSAVYNEAAEQPGVPDAQYALGSLYAAGKGIAQSDTEAVKYLRMAAREGHIKAQFGLGMMFAAGKGVPQSIAIGYLWIARAAEGDASMRGMSETAKAAIVGQNGTAQAVQARDSIRTRMTAAEITNAQILVDGCIAYPAKCNWGG